jgi:hypothetical protein
MIRRRAELERRLNAARVARRLQEGGIDPRQAGTIAEVLADEVLDPQTGLVTRDALHAAMAEVRHEIAELRAEMRTDIAELRAEMRTDIAELRVEMRTEIAALRTGIAQVESRLFMRILIIAGAQVALLGTLIALQ